MPFMVVEARAVTVFFVFDARGSSSSFCGRSEREGKEGAEANMR